jgi:tRNA (adenine37-N6)-methyltransferase
MNTDDTIQLHPIGLIHSRFTDPAGMPIQTAGAPDEPGRIEVLAQYQAGLRDIEEFDYLILITHLHRGSRELLEVTPFLDNQPHGVFATRAPARPNRLGLSIVKLLSVEGRMLHFSGNDMLDGTPVLDIKPYVPRFDSRSTGRIGWFAKRIDGLAGARSDDRMG